jgi:PKD repeat protein
MAEQATAAASKAKSWIKATVGTLAGLLSGAVLMYLTPLLDRVIKPAKPVANFGYQADGLTVTFHNRSSGGSTGWWDFGDGSPLEPVTPDEEIVTHTYTRYGEYSSKLTLRNLLNEESDRTVIVRLEPPRNDPPAISAFEIVPVSPGAYAPATYRIVSKVENAQLSIWDLGDDRPLEVTAEKDSAAQKMVTFENPGAFVVKLVATNGAQYAVKSDIVQVNVPPPGAVTAVLSVNDQAMKLEKVNTPYTFSGAFPPSSREAVYRIDRQVPAQPGFEITDIRIQPKAGAAQRLEGRTEILLDPNALGLRGVRNLSLKLAPDRRSARLTGELVKDTSNKKAPLPTLSLPAVLVQQKKTPVTGPGTPVTATLSVPGVAILTMPPLPADWVETRRQPRLELREGDRVVWQESQLSRPAVVTLQNKRCVVTATATGSQVRVEVAEVHTQAGPIGD